MAHLMKPLIIDDLDLSMDYNRSNIFSLIAKNFLRYINEFEISVFFLF